MIRRLLSTFGFVMLAASPAAAAGIDEVAVKPQEIPSWGELLAGFVGYDGYERSYALVVGISDYVGYKNLPTKRDPIRVKNYLINEAGFDYVHLLTEEKVTVSRVSDLMIDEFPRRVDANDRFLLYWSGHGVTRDVGDREAGYLPVHSTPTGKFARMISMGDIQRWDKLLSAEQTLFVLDACFSGLAGVVAKSDVRRVTIEQMARPSRHLLVAGTKDQETIALDRLGGSVFTAALLDGLRGAADTESVFERDGLVSVNELEDYVKKRVEFERRESGWRKSITPQVRDLASNEGEFFFVTSNFKRGQFAKLGNEATGELEYGVPKSGIASGDLANLVASVPRPGGIVQQPSISPVTIRPTATELVQYMLLTSPVYRPGDTLKIKIQALSSNVSAFALFEPSPGQREKAIARYNRDEGGIYIPYKIPKSARVGKHEATVLIQRLGSRYEEKHQVEFRIER